MESTTQRKRSKSRRAADEPSIEALCAEVGPLVSPPDVFVKVHEVIRSETSNASDFAAVIQQDPSLTARLLRLANSPLMGVRGTVDTITRAVTLVGTQRLYNLTLAVSAVSSFSRLSAELVNMNTFWRHSVFTGLLAKGMAGACDVLHPERLFVAGLLHDVGFLVLFHRVAPVMQDLLATSGGDEGTLHTLERDTLGFTHAEVAARMFQTWGLPEPLVNAVAAHHTYDSDAPVDNKILFFADALAGHTDLGTLFEDLEASPQSPQLLRPAEDLQLDDTALDHIVQQAQEDFVATVNSITG